MVPLLQVATSSQRYKQLYPQTTKSISKPVLSQSVHLTVKVNSMLLKMLLKLKVMYVGLTDATKATIEKEIKRLSKGLEALYGVLAH